MDFGVGGRPHAADLFMLFKSNRYESIFLEDVCGGDPGDARADDCNP